MATTADTDRIAFWQEHITTWQTSGLTQKAYSHEHGLRYSTFGYWARKLRRIHEPATRKKGSGFVSVIPAGPISAGLTLTLPNGLEIRGIETQNLPVVKQLLEVL